MIFDTLAYKIALPACLGAVLLAWGLTYRELRRATSETNQCTADVAQANAKALAEQRKYIEVFMQGTDTFLKGMNNAKAIRDRIVAEQLAGTRKLRDEWALCETSRLSEAAQATREFGAALERRAALAGAIVQIGAECDAKERAFLDIYSQVTP